MDSSELDLQRQLLEHEQRDGINAESLAQLFPHVTAEQITAGMARLSAECPPDSIGEAIGISFQRFTQVLTASLMTGRPFDELIEIFIYRAHVADAQERGLCPSTPSFDS